MENESTSNHTEDTPSRSNSVESTSAQKENSSSYEHSSKKRKLGGRSKNESERFALFETNKQRKARYICCKDQIKYVIWNSTRGKEDFFEMSLISIQTPS